MILRNLSGNVIVIDDEGECLNAKLLSHHYDVDDTANKKKATTTTEALTQQIQQLIENNPEAASLLQKPGFTQKMQAIAANPNDPEITGKYASDADIQKLMKLFGPSMNKSVNLKPEQKQQQKHETAVIKSLTTDGITDVDELRRTRNILLVSGFIREECGNIDFEWIMPFQVNDVCFNLYFIDYKKQLLDICGDEFIKKGNDNKIIKTTFEEDISGNDFILFYFSGEWCPPSKAFTPMLAKFYDECLANNIKLQIIFVSKDQNKDTMLQYYNNYHGSYLALDFDNRSKNNYLCRKYRMQYIPMVTVINKDCKLVEQDARFQIVNHGVDAIKNWQ